MANSRTALDKVLRKARIHFYKPIQIAEILYHHRIKPDFDPEDLESYRNRSKKWRDDISERLVGRVTTSSQKYQDNVFDDNAMPPKLLKELCDINEELNGAMEAYIYKQFVSKMDQLSGIIDYIKTTPYKTIDIGKIVNSFTNSSGLKRSIDKIFEIIVYALFETIVETLDAKVTIEIDPAKRDIANEFSNFTEVVMGLRVADFKSSDNAMFFRVGVTNAADRGLDMWGNFGPAIQIKHISLDVKTAYKVTDGVESDRIIIVCKTCDEETLASIISQMGIRVKGIVTEDTLFHWYDSALRGKYSEHMGPLLKSHLVKQVDAEFPSQSGDMDKFMKERSYYHMSFSDAWDSGSVKIR